MLLSINKYISYFYRPTSDQEMSTLSYAAIDIFTCWKDNARCYTSRSFQGCPLSDFTPFYQR